MFRLEYLSLLALSHSPLYLLAKSFDLSPVCICVCFVSRFQDAVSLVSLFHMVHPHSESAQEAASQQATGTDLLKVRTHNLDWKYLLTRSSVLHFYSLCYVYIIYCHLIQNLSRPYKLCPSGNRVNQESV